MDYLQIPLSGQAGIGKFAKVSKPDYSLLMKYKWNYRDGYALTKINRKEVRMHRLVLNETDPEVLVDHKDRDRLNNQRGNLRRFTHTQNSNNRISSRHIVAFGETKTVGEWAADIRCSCSYNILLKRLDKDILPEAAILAPEDPDYGLAMPTDM
tara:strand:+ start:507 stop:968 length:462 start_codon:yes stop_codon:yes gene_type:complete